MGRPSSCSARARFSQSSLRVLNQFWVSLSVSVPLGAIEKDIQQWRVVMIFPCWYIDCCALLVCSTSVRGSNPILIEVSGRRCSFRQEGRMVTLSNIATARDVQVKLYSLASGTARACCTSASPHSTYLVALGVDWHLGSASIYFTSSLVTRDST